MARRSAAPPLSARFHDRSRRRLSPALGGLWVLLLALACPPAAPALGESGFGYQSVVARAKETASRPFQDPRGEVPDFLMHIDYDKWRDIRFNTARSLWGEDGLLFTAQFFHPGLYYDRMVWVNIVEGSRAGRIKFDADLFNYGQNKFTKRELRELRKLGFAGFRLHYPLNNTDYYDEAAVFLGASYFRSLARGQVYGLSARGLAIDTVSSAGEEFPFFREFWLVKPAPGANEVEIWALLDSRSVAGAYRFVLKPERTTLFEKSPAGSAGQAPPRWTEMDVRATLFFRRQVEKPGIAPLTSMFFYGENVNARPVDDFRPEIHDSDGLLIRFASGEWLWRPLANSKHFQINSYTTRDPAGFGLLQRDSDFDHYQDLETHYERRPSLWIAPRGQWGDGRIELDQIPVQHEILDNIVAYWVPAKPPVPGVPMSFDYTMTWGFAKEIGHPGGQAVATRTAEGMIKEHRAAHLRRFVVDFAGGRLESLGAEDPVAEVVDVSAPAALSETQLEQNRITRGWRLVIQLDTNKLPKSKEPMPVELRAFLKLGEDVLTETWNYTYLHQGPVDPSR